MLLIVIVGVFWCTWAHADEPYRWAAESLPENRNLRPTYWQNFSSKSYTGSDSKGPKRFQSWLTDEMTLVRMVKSFDKLCPVTELSIVWWCAQWIICCQPFSVSLSSLHWIDPIIIYLLPCHLTRTQTHVHFINLFLTISNWIRQAPVHGKHRKCYSAWIRRRSCEMKSLVFLFDAQIQMFFAFAQNTHTHTLFWCLMHTQLYVGPLLRWWCARQQLYGCHEKRLLLRNRHLFQLPYIVWNGERKTLRKFTMTMTTTTSEHWARIVICENHRPNNNKTGEKNGMNIFNSHLNCRGCDSIFVNSANYSSHKSKVNENFIIYAENSVSS